MEPSVPYPDAACRPSSYVRLLSLVTLAGPEKL